MKNYFLSLLVLSFATPALAQTDQRPAPYPDIEAKINESLPPFIGLNREYAEIIHDKQNYVTDKAAQQLIMRQDGLLEGNKLIVSGRGIGTVIVEKTNTDGKFPILSRIPPSHTNKSFGHEQIIQDAQLGLTATLPYTTLYAQGEYIDAVYTGQEKQQWRKYFVTLGDLDVFPMYLSFGKKTVSFGDFVSYAPFTHNHSAHYFWAQTDDDPLFEVGYIDNGWHATASLIKDDRGLRVVNSPEGEDGWNNFAANISKKWMVGSGDAVKFGAGFLRGTIYDGTLAHHPPVFGSPDRNWNGAWDINATYMGGDFDLNFEFTRTLEEWPATDAHVHALTLQGRYFDYIYDFPVTYSLMFSEGRQGDTDDEWFHMMQTVAGFEAKIHPNVSIGVEYLNNIDFVPLILPRLTADDGVVSHTLQVGAKITF